MQDFISKNYRTIVAFVTAILAAIGGTVLVIDTDGPGPKPAHTITIPRAIPSITAQVETADKQKTTVTAPAEAVVQVAKAGESDLRDESPTPANVQAQDDAAQNDQLPLVSPDAAPSQRGCASRFVRNFSSRRGVAPRVITLHETVSNDISGWGDVNAIVAWFNNPRSQASSNYIIDREGHCAYSVRESDKAWTQASANPWVVSFEIINPARRTPTVKNLIDGPGRKKLLGIINDISKRWNIPIRRARNSDCTVSRSGINDHYSWERCGGGHVDVDPFRRSVDPIIVDARRLCAKRYRTAGKRVPARCKA